MFPTKTLIEQMTTQEIARITATATMQANQTRVLVSTAGGAVALTLPPVAEAMGRIYTIYLVTAGNNLVIHGHDARDWVDLTIATATYYYVLFSDGFQWYILDSHTS